MSIDRAIVRPQAQQGCHSEPVGEESGFPRMTVMNDEIPRALGMTPSALGMTGWPLGSDLNGRCQRSTNDLFGAGNLQP